jgi:hypothetical protein
MSAEFLILICWVLTPFALGAVAWAIAMVPPRTDSTNLSAAMTLRIAGSIPEKAKCVRRWAVLAGAVSRSTAIRFEQSGLSIEVLEAIQQQSTNCFPACREADTASTPLNSNPLS